MPKMIVRAKPKKMRSLYLRTAVALLCLSQALAFEAEDDFQLADLDEEIYLAVRGALGKDIDPRALTCSCSGSECSCCVSATFAGYQLANACMKLTYSNGQIMLKFTVGERIVFNNAFTVGNLPSPCMSLGLGNKACLKLYDVNLNGGNLSGCASVEGYTFGVKIGSVRMGCYALKLY